MFDDDRQFCDFSVAAIGPSYPSDAGGHLVGLGAAQRGASSHSAGFHFDHRATLASGQRHWSQFGVVEHVAGCGAGSVRICDRLAGACEYLWSRGDGLCAADPDLDFPAGAITVNRVGQGGPVFAKITRRGAGCVANAADFHRPLYGWVEQLFCSRRAGNSASDYRSSAGRR